MPDLDFSVENVAALDFAAVPTVVFSLRITNRGGEPIHSILLRCQIQIEAARRRYSPSEQMGLGDLFGPPELWSRTLRGMLWLNTTLTVSGLHRQHSGSAAGALQFRLQRGRNPIFAGLENGAAPLSLLFSGTVFFDRAEMLQVSQIPWEKEARCRLPVRTWQDMMNLYYPDTAWLCLRRDVFRRLCDYKRRHGLTSWEETIARALEESENNRMPAEPRR